MIQFPTQHVRRKLQLELLNRKYDIDQDEALESVVLDIMECSEDEYPLHELTGWLPELFDFDYRWVSVPGEVGEEEYESYGYMVLGAFQIPDLIPYAKEAKYDDFFDSLDRFCNTASYGNNIELVYLPTSTFANSAKPIEQKFGKQPGAFMIGLQDDGCINMGDIVDFLSEVRSFNYDIMNFLSREERKTI